MRHTTKAPLAEVWMQVIDPKQIKKLMVIQGVSQRTLAHHAGHRSHAYIGRVLRGDVKTVTPEVAARIAALFSVGVDDLFIARVSSGNRQNTEAGAA